MEYTLILDEESTKDAYGRVHFRIQLWMGKEVDYAWKNLPHCTVMIGYVLLMKCVLKFKSVFFILMFYDVMYASLRIWMFVKCRPSRRYWQLRIQPRNSGVWLFFYSQFRSLEKFSRIFGIGWLSLKNILFWGSGNTKKSNWILFN